MKADASAGYSGTPLVRKLGIAAGSEVFLHAAPPGFEALLEPLPEGVHLRPKPAADTALAHVFVTDRAELARWLQALRKQLKPGVPVWVSWPKKSSRVPSTVTEDVIRELALPLGYVDVKVCAVTQVWSGLKLVVRKELR